MPLSITAGANYSLVGMLNLALDISYEPIDDRKIVSFGTEYWPTKFFALRAGYLVKAIESFYGTDSGFYEDDSDKKGWGGGIGFKIFNNTVDYAVMPYGSLGITQRISFLMNF